MQENSPCNLYESQATAHPLTYPMPCTISPPLTSSGVTDFCYAYDACTVSTQALAQYYSKNVHTQCPASLLHRCYTQITCATACCQPNSLGGTFGTLFWM